MKIRQKRRGKTVLVLKKKEIEVLKRLVDIGFDDFFRIECGGDHRLKRSKIAAKIFDDLDVAK